MRWLRRLRERWLLFREKPPERQPLTLEFVNILRKELETIRREKELLKRDCEEHNVSQKETKKSG